MSVPTYIRKKNLLLVSALAAVTHAGVTLAANPAWAPDVFYSAGTVVSYQGGDYRALVNQVDYSSTGWTPKTASLWAYVGANSGSTGGSTGGSGSGSTGGSSGGSSGSGSGGGSSGGTCYTPWTNTKVYNGGDTASYSGINYKANWWTQGNAPASNSGPAGSGQPWTSVGSCSGSTGGGSTGGGSSGGGSTGGSSGGGSTGGGSTGGGSTGGTAPAGFVFGPYKDITVNMNWNTNVMSTAVNGSTQTVLNAMPAKLKTLTWSFATGECGSENWGGISAASVASANVNNFVAASKNYIISTGGAAGSFSCGSDANFDKFIKTYYSANMVGVDFDIEAGQSQSVINNLVLRVKAAQKNYPNMRFSFTLATLGGSDQNSLGSAGVTVMNAIKANGLTNYYINLMTMDYGSTGSYNCTIGSNGLCDMGASAVKAAQNLHNAYGVPYGQIEVTPMIGGNDTLDETFTLADVTTLSNFAKTNKLAGIHFWSLDRDHDCAPSYASPTCNTYGKAGTLGFTNKFINDLGL